VNFNSLEFLVFFLPASFVAFHAVPMRWRLWVLVAASLVFHGVSGLEVLLAFMIAILWTYGIVFLFGKWPKLPALLIAVSVPLFFLVMFKYLNFILESVRAGPEVRSHLWFFFSILLPAGISFYTFEMISYGFDVADGKIEPDRDLSRFASFATFFPHLIAGPIMRYADLQKQLRMLQSVPILKPDLVSGLKLLSIGLIFKIFVADVSGMRIAKVLELPAAP
jgi:alginate O-acetyltransferase complex protein AlgI